MMKDFNVQANALLFEGRNTDEKLWYILKPKFVVRIKWPANEMVLVELFIYYKWNDKKKERGREKIFNGNFSVVLLDIYMQIL